MTSLTWRYKHVLNCNICYYFKGRWEEQDEFLTAIEMMNDESMVTDPKYTSSSTVTTGHAQYEMHAILKSIHTAYLSLPRVKPRN